MPNESTQPTGECLLYQTEDDEIRVECRFEAESLWLSQALMAKLFDRDMRTINEHLKTIYAEGELNPEATIRKFRIAATDAKLYNTQIAGTRTIPGGTAMLVPPYRTYGGYA